jgi:hypothetical protein
MLLRSPAITTFWYTDWGQSQTIRISTHFRAPRGEGFYRPGSIRFRIEGCRDISRLLPIFSNFSVSFLN